MGNQFLRILILSIVGVKCLECPNHCLCYTWNSLVRTDCIRRNLLNTFVRFSHQTQVLDLSHNVISILHGNEFLDGNLRQLQDINLSNNRLHKIDKISFNGLEFLQNLDLSFNSIEYLHPMTFKYNPNLKSLNLSFNPLTFQKNEPFLSSPISLQILDLTNCQLEFVSSNTFSDLKRLLILNISRNYIRSIEPEFVDEMKSLRYLEISKNVISCQDFLQHKIHFQTSCQTTQKLSMITKLKEITTVEIQPSFRDLKNNTQSPSQDENFFENVIRFFQSIPSFYAIICGIQVGVFIGSFSTYACLRRSIKKAKEQAILTRRYVNGDSDNSTYALIALNTPPGTPPSPYHSRYFSSVSAT